MPCIPPPRVRSQLALQVPAELLARLQAAATASGRTKTSLATQCLEAGLAELRRQPSPPARPACRRATDSTR